MATGRNRNRFAAPAGSAVETPVPLAIVSELQASPPVPVTPEPIAHVVRTAARSFESLCKRYGVSTVEAAGLRRSLKIENGLVKPEDFVAAREALAKTPAGR